MNLEFLETLAPAIKNRIKGGYNAVSSNHMALDAFVTLCKELLNQSEFAILFNQSDPVTVPPLEEIKTEHLQDIIQYSGINLKEEAENMVKDSEDYIGFTVDSYEESTKEIDSLMSYKNLVEFVAKRCRIPCEEDVYNVLFLAVRRKITDFYEKMIKISKIRVDEDSSNYIIRITNDIRRQLWVLEQNEKKEFERLKIEKNETEEKKKLKKIIEEREDLLIKKRMSNSIALAALGSQQKSWMAASDDDMSKEIDSQFQSLYSPFNEKDLDKKISNRQITMEDFLYVLETDPKYNKSIFTLQNYYK